MALADLAETTFTGPPVDDDETYVRCPPELRRMLDEANGVVAFGGGLHVRGACREPDWHSLRAAWDGPLALHDLYDEVLFEDVPFAEDALGDQFLLRDGQVLVLRAEDGQIDGTPHGLESWLAAVVADPVGVLSLHPL